MRRFILPILLLVMFLCGGTSQYIPQPKFIAYGVSIILIGFSIFAGLRGNAQTLSEKSIWNMVLLIILICVLQLIPLPPGLWTALPGREIVTTGFELTEYSLPWLPLSLTPEITLYSVLDFLPPIAILAYILAFATHKEINLTIYGVLGFAAICAFIGFAQILSGGDTLYPYKVTNTGRPTAFFSNTNHFATFMLMSLCFSLHYMTKDIGAGISALVLRRTRSFTLGGMISLVLIFGIISTKSLAAVGILAVLLSLFFVIYRHLSWLKNEKTIGWFFIFSLIMAIIVFLILDLLLEGNLVLDVFDTLKGESDFSRRKIYPEVIKQILIYFPFGTGLGSFEQVFGVNRDLENTIGQFVNHAHNDYLELLLEYGLFGVIFLGLFLKWWFKSWQFTLSLAGKLYGQFFSLRIPALLATGIVLMHSMVDYPARTIAISCFTAFCVGVICKTDRQQVSKQTPAAKQKTRAKLDI